MPELLYFHISTPVATKAEISWADWPRLERPSGPNWPAWSWVRLVLARRQSSGRLRKCAASMRFPAAGVHSALRVRVALCRWMDSLVFANDIFFITKLQSQRLKYISKADPMQTSTASTGSSSSRWRDSCWASMSRWKWSLVMNSEEWLKIRFRSELRLGVGLIAT